MNERINGHLICMNYLGHITLTITLCEELSDVVIRSLLSKETARRYPYQDTRLVIMERIEDGAFRCVYIVIRGKLSSDCT